MRIQKPKTEAFITYGSVLVIHDGLAAQSMHRHRPFELIIAVDGEVRINTDYDKIHKVNSLVIPPLVQHSIDRYDGRIARIYFDPAMRKIVNSPAMQPDLGDGRLLARVRAFFESDRSLENAKQLMTEWQNAWGLPSSDTASCDPRVALALNLLDDRLMPTADRYSVANQVGLSPSRFASIFVAEPGVPLRRYVIWRRLLFAARLIREGSSATEAAIGAGFSDHAHFSRCYRATFGSSPSDFQMIKIDQPTSKRHLCREAIRHDRGSENA